nr:NADH dehydrogenase subunit 4L [Micropodarke fujianensis]
MRSIIMILMPLTTMSALITMVLQRQHLLMALLALEGVILTLTAISTMLFSQEIFFVLILLSFGACEASLGLACLVSMTRSYGNDLFNSITSTKC